MNRQRPSLHLSLIMLLVVSLPFLKLHSFEVAGIPVSATELLFLATAAAWAVAVALGRARLRGSRFYAPLAAYLVAMALSVVVSQSPRASVAKLVGGAYLVSLAALVFNIVDRLSIARSVLLTWLLTSAATAIAGVAGIVAFYAGVRDRAVNLVLWNYGSLPPGNYPRLSGFFLNGNMYCNYLIIGLIVLFWAHYANELRRSLLALLVAATVITAAFTISPGLGGLAAATGLWLRFLCAARGRPRLGRVFIGVGFSAAVAFIAITSVALGGGKLGPSPRLLAWRDAAGTFLAAPILGKGVGTNPASVQWTNPSGVTEHLTEAHNVWLSIAAQEGVVGLAAFAALTIFLLRRWLRRRGHSAASPMIASLGAAFCGSLLVQGWTGSFEDTRHLWVLMGLLAAVSEPSLTT